MAKATKDDDLFSDSTMSFGEHLEELRGSLARAIVGLVIGIGIAFIFADDAVRWIESPLKEGLTEFHIKKAHDKYRDKFEPEQLNLIAERRFAPTETYVEAAKFMERLREVYPEQFADVSLETYGFRPEDLPADAVSDLCSELLSGKEGQRNPLRSAVWKLLSDEQRAAIEQIADAEVPSDGQRESVVETLNELLEKRELCQVVDKHVLKRAFPLRQKREAAARLVQQAKETDSPDRMRRVNRLLLAATFAPYLRQSMPPLIDLPIWQPIDASVQTLNAQEAFMVWFKAAFVLGAIIASPWIFIQIWGFVAAGLYPHEKHYVYTFLPFSLGLFLAGAAMAFFFVFPFVLKFLFSFNQRISTDPNLRLSEWVNFALFLPLGFGISFQLPLVMLLLERIGIFTIGAYLSKWRVAVLVIAVISMLLTPADPSSMLLMGIPLTVLYFGGIGLCKWMPKRRSPVGEGYDPS